ncbi:hypothetical protein CMO92_04640 [Candidatus Woesearchaeota archaeon]|nr:hypothetical protein [Candidatus Woesearchaeota archaeon]|tara:strand:+ start:329 stop:769 length:441 start_codon:yes stop_codon:yes gene_type:complete
MNTIKQYIEHYFQQYPWLKEFIKFCMVGAVGVAINSALFFTAFHILHKKIYVSFAIGYLTAFIFAFYFNMIFTFKIKNKSRFYPLMFKYLGVSIVTLIIGALTLKSMVEVILINVNIAFFLNLGITTVLNFTGNKFYTFKPVGDAE